MLRFCKMASNFWMKPEGFDPVLGADLQSFGAVLSGLWCHLSFKLFFGGNQMRPQGRAAAAITILDRVLSGEPAEKALTSWGRGARYAGSGDRLAVRDIVYDCLRKRRSLAAAGGGLSGRGLVLGWLRTRGENTDLWFDGSDHAPAPVDALKDQAYETTETEALDLPDWLFFKLKSSLGTDFLDVAELMRERAPAILRVNAARGSRESAIIRLKADGVQAVVHPLADWALEVTEGARKIQNSEAFQTGLVELQDAASQAVVEALPLKDGMKVLDHCAGGGGKTLAMGALAQLNLWAHDAASSRLEALRTRAARAGLKVEMTARPEDVAPFDLVLTDVPCSGSGSWRRDPEGKWRLTSDRLDELTDIQASILDRASAMVAPGGYLAYATCSFLKAENEEQIAAFIQRAPAGQGWALERQQRFSPLDGGDGFYYALLRRSA